jgi:hypothetical protein
MTRLTADGVRFAANDEFNSKRQIFDTGTFWVFYQTNAPVGWTKTTTHDNKALRVVSGTGGGSGGNRSFTSIFSSNSFSVSGPINVSGSVGGKSISLDELPSHSHTTNYLRLSAVPELRNPDGVFTGWNGGDVGRPPPGSGFNITSPSTGGVSETGTISNPHNHPFSGSATCPATAVDTSVQYIDIILCSFDG